MRLSFKPLTIAETEKLFEGFPPLVEFVTTFKTATWLNSKNRTLLYGVQMKKDGEWINVMFGKRALVFDNESDARYVCNSLRKGSRRVANRKSNGASQVKLNQGTTASNKKKNHS